MACRRAIHGLRLIRADLLPLGEADRHGHGRLSSLGSAFERRARATGGSAGAGTRGPQARGFPTRIGGAMRATSLGLMLAISASPLQAQQVALDARTAQAIVTGCAAHATAKNQ